MGQFGDLRGQGALAYEEHAGWHSRRGGGGEQTGSKEIVLYC